MAISELEPSPNPFDGNFDEVADNFLGVGLPRLREEINATEENMEAMEAAAVAAAAAAAGAVGTVADAAAAAANAASLADTRATAAQAAKVAAETARDLAQTYGAALSGTSTSNLTITKVSKVFATQAGKAWTLGQRLRAASDDGTKVMEGALTDYAGTNLTVLVDYTKGTGSHADWNISVGGEQGGEGPPGSGTGTVNSVNNHEPDEDGAVVIPDATTTEAGLQSAADKVKLDSIAAGASANDTDANLRARANHTGTQAIATVTGLQAALDGKMAAAANSDAVTEGASNLYFTVQRVRDAVLTGLSMASAAAVTAADTVLVAFGKLQKQVTDNLAALTGHTGDTANPHATTATQVGLGNVTNTSDANKPVSTAQQTALDLKANLASPALTGTPTAPTAAAATNTTQLATTAHVFAERTNTATLTNKTIALGSNTVSGTTAQFNTALSDGDFATLAGAETLTNKTLTAPALGTPTSGNLSTCTADGTDAVGFRNIPQNSRSAAYTLVLADSGKHILHPSADTTARTFTIPANGSVAYPIGTALTFINQNSAGVVTIAITTDTMRLAGAGTTGSRTLAANGVATAVKVTSTEWIISGTGLT